MEHWRIISFGVGIALIFLVLGLRLGSRAYWLMQVRAEVEERKKQLARELRKAREEYIAAKATLESVEPELKELYESRLRECRIKKEVYHTTHARHQEILWVLVDLDAETPPLQ